MAYILSRRRFIAGSTAALSTCCFDAAWSTAAPVSLPIPELVDGTSGDPVNLKIRNGAWSFKPGIETPTLGISQDYLGPTIRTRRNSKLNLHYENSLSEGVAIHGHGLHVPGEVNGGPQLEIAPGEKLQPTLSITQPAATCWYRSQTYGKAGSQVYRGLAGMIIIDDDVADAAEIPRRYGVDDLPVIIQDRTFDAQGRLVYSLKDAGENGWYGETVIINGAISPVAKVPAGKVRLRLLNAANARFYIVAFADNRQFYKIASDGGFLTAPVPLTTMEMAPGERCEIVIDLSDGEPAELLTLFESEMNDEDASVSNVVKRFFGFGKTKPRPSLTLVVDRELPAHKAPLPGKLADTIVRPTTAEISRTRHFVLDMKNGEGDPDKTRLSTVKALTINGASMDKNVINERVKRGKWERWRVRSIQGTHSFHVHGCSFLIERMDGEAATPDQEGWKDTIVLDDEEDWSVILVRFDHPASDKHPFLYQCQILEHGDRGMMGQLTVS